MRQFLFLAMVFLLAGCAGIGDEREGDRAERMAVYERHAGASENWVRYSRIRNWWSVGMNSVVLEVDSSRHYLLRLIGPCSMDLDTTAILRLVSSRPNVLGRSDDLIVGGQRCDIQSIHRLDYEAVKAELEQNGVSEPEKQDEVRIETEDQSSDAT